MNFKKVYFTYQFLTYYIIVITCERARSFSFIDCSMHVSHAMCRIVKAVEYSLIAQIDTKTTNHNKRTQFQKQKH